MRRIFIECLGRMANQILCFANAGYVRDDLNIRNAKMVLSCSLLTDGRIRFPDWIEVTEGERPPKGLIRANRRELRGIDMDCMWEWKDVYSQMPEVKTLSEYIKQIELSDGILGDIASVHGKIPVGVHIRYGDYVAAGDTSSPFQRAEESYYLDAMEVCRKKLGKCSFYVASDGKDHELKFVENHDVAMGRRKDPVFDLFSLSKCRVIIGSNSTFSSVASYHGNVPMVTPSMGKSDIERVIGLA